MDIFEIATTNRNLTPAQFYSFAELFFTQNKFEIFSTREEAEEILERADSIAAVLQRLDQEHVSNSMLMMGSIFGEALILVFGGKWEYSDSQERWVIVCVNSKGEEMAFNIFHKLKKYAQNGDEDSLNYYFEQIRSLYHS